VTDLSPAKTRPKSSEVRERVLQVAARLFAERGFHAVSVRDIAAACGVSVSTVLYQGGSKQGLLEQILAESFAVEAPLTSFLLQLDPDSVTSREELLEFYDQFVDLLVSHSLNFPENRRLWLRLLLDQPDLFRTFEAQYIWPLHASVNRFLVQLHERGVLQLTPDQAVFFVASIDWMLDGFCVGGILGAGGTRTGGESAETTAGLIAFLKQSGRRILV
jgi:AcrR family transcriptional regulator